MSGEPGDTVTNELVLVETNRAGVATVTLNRPDHLNALTDAMVARLWTVMDGLSRDAVVRVIVLTGAGRAFCAGADVTDFGEQTPREIVRKLPRLFDQTQAPDFQTRHLYFPAIPKPVIAMINGPAAGLGLLYALTSDVRFVSEEATVTTGFARLGLGAEYGMDWLLHHVVGHAHALELALSSRKVKGVEAARIGLAHFSGPAASLGERVAAYAHDMATGCSPQSLALMKRQFWGVSRLSAGEAVRAALRDMLVTNASSDYAEGKAAFLERRAPRFAPLPEDGVPG